jgi:hypothetical protein
MLTTPDPSGVVILGKYGDNSLGDTATGVTGTGVAELCNQY